MFSQKTLRRWSWLGLLMLLLTVTPAHAALPPPYALPPTIQLEGYGGPPRTDGKTVIWATKDSRDNNLGGIAALHIESGQRSMVVEHRPGLGGYEDRVGNSRYMISQGIVLWHESREATVSLRMKKLVDGQELEIASAAGIQSPALIGDTVYWWWLVKAGDPIKLMARNIRTLEPAREILQTPFTVTGIAPVKSDGVRLVWAKGVGYSNRGIVYWDITVLDPGASTPRVVVKDVSSNAEFDIAVIPDHILYIKERTVTRLNLTTGESTVLTDTIVASHIAASSRFAFWSQLLPTHTDFSQQQLGGYDLTTGSHFQVPTASSFLSYMPQISGDLLIWRTVDQRTTTTLHFQKITELLPSAPRGNPAQPGRLYFPASGHTLGHERFLPFWERSGGLPVFGLPLTEEFRELNRDTQKLYVTQYFERQRFEYHPENAGTPYEVLLGRLGAEILAQQGRDWRTFPRANPTAPHYVAETGHAIAPEFWDYWRAHGLEFGDQGVSAAEALALFGYPLSEAQMEVNSSGDRVLTQWFERARFEYHPNNPAEHKVLLGRLAADTLVNRSWR